MEEKEKLRTEYKQNEVVEINLISLIRKLITSKKKLYKALIIGAVIGAIIGISIPKRYQVEVSISPESGLSASNSLAGIASMFGLGNSTSDINGDALSFNLFPEIIKSNPFVIEMLTTNVLTMDNKQITLYNYLDTEKSPWWNYIFKIPGKAVHKITSIFIGKNIEAEIKNKNIDCFHLTAEQKRHVDALKSILKATINKKTNTTEISVILQDPQVAAIVADSAVNKLQTYITNYRTRKAEQDYEFQVHLCEQYRDNYFKAQQDYAKFSDSNKNIILQAVATEKERLQKNLQLAEQIYSQSMAQLQVLQGKVQEAKPVFAVVNPASIPLIPTGPRTLTMIIGFAFLFFVFESAWILFGKDIYHDFKKELKKQD